MRASAAKRHSFRDSFGAHKMADLTMLESVITHAPKSIHIKTADIHIDATGKSAIQQCKVPVGSTFFGVPMKNDVFHGWKIEPPHLCSENDEVWWVNGRISSIRDGTSTHIALPMHFSSRTLALRRYFIVARLRILALG